MGVLQTPALPLGYAAPSRSTCRAPAHRARGGFGTGGAWSGKRGSNPRPQPWQGCALPTELFAPDTRRYEPKNVSRPRERVKRTRTRNCRRCSNSPTEPEPGIPGSHTWINIAGCGEGWMFDTQCLHGNRLPCGVLVMALVMGMGFAALKADAEVPGASRSTAGPERRSSTAGVVAADVAALTRAAPPEPRLAKGAEELSRRFGVGRRLAGIIYEEAKRAGIEPAMAFGVVAQESGFDPSAVGRSGERGLMQIKP